MGEGGRGREDLFADLAAADLLVDGAGNELDLCQRPHDVRVVRVLAIRVPLPSESAIGSERTGQDRIG